MPMGDQAVSLPPSSLRTVRVKFLAYGSRMTNIQIVERTSYLFLINVVEATLT